MSWLLKATLMGLGVGLSHVQAGDLNIMGSSAKLRFLNDAGSEVADYSCEDLQKNKEDSVQEFGLINWLDQRLDKMQHQKYKYSSVAHREGDSYYVAESEVSIRFNRDGELDPHMLWANADNNYMVPENGYYWTYCHILIQNWVSINIPIWTRVYTSTWSNRHDSHNTLQWQAGNTYQEVAHGTIVYAEAGDRIRFMVDHHHDSNTLTVHGSYGGASVYQVSGL